MKFEKKTLKEISGGGSYGLGASASKTPNGPKFLRTTDIVRGTIDWDDVPFCEADASTIHKYRLSANDIVISRTGANAGLNCIVTKPPTDAIFAGYLVRFQIDERVADARYVSYVLRSSSWDEYVANTRTGSAQPQLNAVLMGEFSLSLPPLETQRVISQTLVALDEKIDSNHRLAQTLEQIAQTVFKSWFVDYDPVKAKMAGEKPFGMDDATAALFPDSMEDSELGPIPTGWKLQSLSEIGEFRNGLAMQKFPVVDVESVLPVIKIAQLRAGNTFGADLASGHIDPKFVVSDGDILFSWSGTLEIEHWAGGPGALNQHLFKVLGKTVPDWFIFSSSRSHLPEFRKIASGKATTMGHIQRAHLEEAKVAVPPVALLEEVSELFSALVAQKVSLLLENRTLAQLRDSLLPRLISGELQIPEEMLVS